MKKTKQYISILLTVLTVFTALPFTVFAENKTIELDLINKKSETLYFDDYYSGAPENNGIVDFEDFFSEAKIKAKTWSGKSYSGSEIDLSSCLYTVTNAGTEKKYTVSNTRPAELGQNQDTTIYLNPLNNKTADGVGGFPGSDTSCDIEFIKADSGFNIKGTIGSESRFLVFKSWLCYHAYNDLTTKVAAVDTTVFNLYKKAENGELTPDIPGYVKVTDIEDGEYLIVSSLNGSNYVLRPSLDNGNRNSHVAQVNNTATGYTRFSIVAKAEGTTTFDYAGNTYNVKVTNNQPVKNKVDVTLRVGQTLIERADISGFTSVTDIQSNMTDINVVEGKEDVSISLGTTNNFDASKDILSSCLYTFNKVDGGFYISSTTASGNTVYLNLGGNAYIPNDSVPRVIELSESGQGAWFLRDTVQNAYLYNYRGNNNQFNRWGPSVDPATCYFLIFRPLKQGETVSNDRTDVSFPGYVLVNNGEQFEDGEQYVIISHSTVSDGGSGYYALHPAEVNKGSYEHVAKLYANTSKIAEVTFTGKKEGKEQITIGNTIFNIDVIPEDAIFEDSQKNLLSKLTISNNTDFDLNLIDEYMHKEVVWSSADTNIASVDQNGIITTHNAGDTQIKAAFDGKTHVFDITVIETGYSGEHGVLSQFRVKEMSNTRAWMVIVGGKENNLTYEYKESDFIEMTPYEKIYLYFNSTSSTGINVYAKPEDGYALTYMAASGSAGNYYAIDKATMESTYASGAGYTQITNGQVTHEQLMKLLNIADSMECDGFFGFSHVDLSCDYSFRSQPLPKLSKSVAAIKHRDTNQFVDYVEGMAVVEGDTVVFDVSVENFESSETITYTDAILTEQLDTAVFDKITKDSTFSEQSGDGSVKKEITGDLNLDKKTGQGMKENTHHYYVEYKIKPEDANKPILNEVDFTYEYKSQYSVGSLSNSSASLAKITVVEHQLQLKKDLDMGDTIILDFGLPVKLDYNKAVNDINKDLSESDKINLVSGSSVNGYADVEVDSSRNIVTYTPKKVIQGEDILELLDNKGEKYYVPVWPATTVYYEEEFIDKYSDTTLEFETYAAERVAQDAEALGHKINNYGYDAAYLVMPESYSVAYEAEAARGKIEFTGTGIDIYANCTPETGKLMLSLKKYDEVNSKWVSKGAMTVDTATGGNGTATKLNNIDYGYSLPAFSYENLEYGKYQLSFSHLKNTGDVYIDGFRVYNTLNDEDIYNPDNESKPVFVELRDLILSVQDIASSIIEELATAEAKSESLYNSIYRNPGMDSNDSHIVVVDANGGNADIVEDDAKDILLYGPKNELYLKPGQAVVFKIASNKIAQLGMKAYNDEVTYSVNVGSGDTAYKEDTMTTHTDLFYMVGTDVNGETLITITNKEGSKGVLSVTKVKILDKPSGETPAPVALRARSYSEPMFVALESEDFVPVFYALGLVEQEEEIPDTPEVPDMPEDPSGNDTNSFVKLIQLIKAIIDAIRNIFKVVFG